MMLVVLEVFGLIAEVTRLLPELLIGLTSLAGLKKYKSHF